MPKIERLNLGRNRIGDEGVGALAASIKKGKLKYLKDLSLHHNRIGDDGLGALASCMGDKSSLEKLYLDGNQSSAKGLNFLADALNKGACPNLEALVVDKFTAPVSKACSKRKKLTLSH